jgi:hypothetical protein
MLYKSKKGTDHGLTTPPFLSRPILTLSCLTMRLLCVLTLAIDISPNNSPISLISSEEMIVHVMAIHFAL